MVLKINIIKYQVNKAPTVMKGWEQIADLT